MANGKGGKGKEVMNPPLQILDPPLVPLGSAALTWVLGVLQYGLPGPALARGSALE